MRLAGVVVLVPLVFAACGGASPGAPRQAGVALSASPNPVQEEPCGACGTLPDQLWAVTTLSVRETGGVGGRVAGVVVSLRNDQGTSLGGGRFDAAAIMSQAGTSRVEANGLLSIPGMGPHYDRSLGGRPATLSLTLQLDDDNAHHLEVSLDVPVLPVR
jgi:hypothetical protein